MTGNVDYNVRPDPDQILVKIADYVLDQNIESKESLTTTSKSSALEQKLSDSTIVIEELGETVSYLLREKEELIEFNAALLTEVRKPRYFSTAPIMKRAGLPVASQAVHRKYMGLGSPTLLKFKREDGNDDKK